MSNEPDEEVFPVADEDEVLGRLDLIEAAVLFNADDRLDEALPDDELEDRLPRPEDEVEDEFVLPPILLMPSKSPEALRPAPVSGPTPIEVLALFPEVKVEPEICPLDTDERPALFPVKPDDPVESFGIPMVDPEVLLPAREVPDEVTELPPEFNRAPGSDELKFDGKLDCEKPPVPEDMDVAGCCVARGEGLLGEKVCEGWPEETPPRVDARPEDSLPIESKLLRPRVAEGLVA